MHMRNPGSRLRRGKEIFFPYNHRNKERQGIDRSDPEVGEGQYDFREEVCRCTWG